LSEDRPSTEAEADVEEIWRYIATDGGTKIADRVEDELIDSFRRLASSKAIGRRRAGVNNPRLRFVNVNRFVSRPGPTA
jgi:plasmid stabilization system protein ParE